MSKAQHKYSADEIIFLRRQAGIAKTTDELRDRFNRHFKIDLSTIAIKQTLVRWGIKSPESRHSGTICWECKHSTPNHRPGCKPKDGKPTGCSWSMAQRPVEGWVANPTIICHSTKDGGIREDNSYAVRYCPKFEKG